MWKKFRMLEAADSPQWAVASLVMGVDDDAVVVVVEDRVKEEARSRNRFMDMVHGVLRCRLALGGFYQRMQPINAGRCYGIATG